MERDKADLLNRLDEMMAEKRRVLAAISVRGGKGSSEWVREQGAIRALGQAYQAVADWFEEGSKAGADSESGTAG